MVCKDYYLCTAHTHTHNTDKCELYDYNMHSHPSTTTNYGRKLVTRRKNEKVHTNTQNQLHDALNWKTFDRDDNCYIYFCCGCRCLQCRCC